MQKQICKIMLATLVFMFLFNFNSANSKINNKSNEYKYPRADMIVPNMALIRFKQAQFNNVKAEKMLSNIKVSIVEPLLYPVESIKNQKNMTKGNKILSSKQINKILKAEEPLLRSYIIKYEGNQTPQEFCSELVKNNPEIEIAEPYYKNEMQYTPNDFYSSAQTNLSVIKALNAWDSFQGDTNVIIAISDNGVFRKHVDLSGNIAPNWGEIPNNNIDDDGNVYIDDFMGYNFSYLDEGTEADDTYHQYDHGTGVAGVACASTDNMLGIAGIGFKCRMFPLKTALAAESSLTYGYQSIKYAAIRGCKVINCSWGLAKNYSQIDQSIIDFAVAHDLAIVAAGGNGYSATEPWYPANYHGVLGVGEVNLSDIVTSSTSMGSHIKIMAPGEGNYATGNYNDYNTNTGGTSFASPVVAGFVGFIRSKYPNLDPIQSIEFARQCVDDISSLNSYWRNIIPGRVNMQKALDIDPMSIPSIRHLKTTYKDISGNVIQRFLIDNEVTMSIDAHNYLGAANYLKFTISVATLPNGIVELIDSVVTINNIASDVDLTIQPFRFRIKSKYNVRMFFRVDIEGPNNYKDFFLIPFIPTSEVTTFENNAVKFSVSDRGNIGYGGIEENKEGVGFVYKVQGNQIYEAGLMATENNSTVISTCYGTGPGSNDFEVVKPFYYPDIRIGTAIDSNENSKKKIIGLEINQEFILDTGDESIAKVLVKAKNVSGKTLNDVAVGYFFDWDVAGNSGENTVRLFPEAIPEGFAEWIAAAEIAEYRQGYPVVGCLVYSDGQNDEPQAAGSYYSRIANWGSNKADHISFLNSGTSIQTSETDDINMVVGMKFPGNLAPNEEVDFILCFGAADTPEELAEKLKNRLLGVNDLIPNKNDFDVLISPQPANDRLSIKVSLPTDFYNISISNSLGQVIYKNNNVSCIAGENNLYLNTENYGSGVYYIQISFGNNIINKKFVIVK